MSEDLPTLRIVDEFERCTLAILDHEAHVRIAWYYLNRAPLEMVLKTFPEKLRRYAESKGAPRKYHETITFAFICLIHDRLIHDRLVQAPAVDWSTFKARNPDLLSRAVLRRYYAPEVLDSGIARRRFLFPLPAFPAAAP